MKKKLMTCAKKSVSMLLVCLMLMTCWVFIAPTHIHAAKYIYNYTLEQLYQTYLVNDITTIVGSFGGDTTTNNAQYVNVLYSPAYTTTDIYSGVASDTYTYSSGDCGGSVSADVDWHHAVTTMYYDGGATRPQTGVMMTVDPNGGGSWAGAVTTYRSWLSNSDLQFPSYWKGVAGTLDFAWCMNQGNMLNYLSTQANDSMKVERNKNDEPPVFANVMKYTGTMNDNTYYVDIVPEFNHYGEGDGKGGTITKKSSNHIYVINYKQLKAAITEARTVVSEAIANRSLYTQDSIAKLTSLANALAAARPNNYINSSSNDVTTYAADAKAAVDAWNAWGGLVKGYDVTWVNHDDTTLETDIDVVAGTTPTYNGATPTKAAEASYHYVFFGWSPAVSAVSADITYKAQFNTVAHTIVTVPGTAATCTSTGLSESKYCSECGYVTVPQTTTSMTEHTWKDATCEAPKTCTVCNATEGSVGGHTWKDATCTAPKTCTECGATEGEKLAHDYDSVVTAPTCTANGYTTYTCRACAHTYTDNVVDALGHNFTNVLTGSANYTDTHHNVRCSRYYSHNCGGQTTAEHNFNTTVSTEGATCTDKGIVTKKCACGKTTQVEGEIAPDVHNYDYTAGTPNNDKATHKVACTYNPAHTVTVNCTDADNNCYCDICDQELVHTFDKQIADEDYLVSKAECEIDAVYYYSCKCGLVGTDTWEDEGSALEHVYTDYEYNDDATCYDNGTMTATCDNGCGTESTIEAEGTKRTHIFEGIIKNNEDGTHSYECTYDDCTAYGDTVDCSSWKENTADGKCECEDCGYTKAHAWSAWKESSGNTGLAEGTMTRTCSDCNTTEETACTYRQTNHVDANCTSPERTTYECTVCGHGYTKIGEPATGHSFTTNTYRHDAASDRHQILCANGCGEYGIGTTSGSYATCTWTYANKESGKHEATCVCGNTEEQNCSGGTATCTAPAECQYCGEDYGTTSDHSFKGDAVKLDGDVHAYLCEFCGDTTDIHGIGNTVGATEACSGGTATCTELAECDICKDTHGGYADHSFKGDAVKLEGDVHAYRCENCNNETIYGVGSEIDKTEACSGGDATCSALAVCDICKDTHGELEADDHKWGETPVADADNAGNHIYTCEYDNDHKKSEDCVSGSSEVVAPKCEEQGYTIQTCEKCTYQWNTDPVDALDHDWGDWVDNDNLTHTRTCEREGCDYGTDGAAKTETEACSKENAASVVTTPTCTEAGYTTYTCNVCEHEWIADETPATGHTWENTKTFLKSEEDCTNDAVYYQECSVCKISAEDDTTSTGKTWTDEDSRLGHDYQDLVDENDLENNRVSEATCTEKAVYYKSCSRCGVASEETFEYGEALGHAWTNTEKYVHTVSDCITDAVYYKECSRCNISSQGETGETWTKENSKSGHKFESEESHTAYKAPTCSDEGNIEYYTCDLCDAIFKDQGVTEISSEKTVIAALGHDWVDVAFKAATCEEDGHSAYKDCSRCDAIKDKVTEGYEATGHKFTGAYYCDTVNNYHSKKCVNADCTATGLGTGEEAVKYSAEFDGLDYVIKGGEKCDFASSEAVTDENGIHSHKLACVCGNETSKAYADEDTFVETVAPTCTVNGYDVHECPDCDATWQKNIVAASGHTLAEKATQNEDGKTHSIKCSKCDYATGIGNCSGGTATCKDKAVCETCNTAYGETTGHTLAENGWTSNNDATCTKDGTKSQNCSVCEQEVKVTDEGSVLGHSMTEYGYDISKWAFKPDNFNEDIKEPTCGEEGLSISYCTRCEVYDTDAVSKNKDAHVWDTDENGEEVWDVIGGDCSSGVTSVKTCTVCGEREAKTEKVNHTWAVIAVKEAGCVENGYIDLRCDVCEFTATLKGTKAEDYVLGEVNYADEYNVIATGNHTWQTAEPADGDYVVIDGIIVFVEKYPAYNATGRGYKKCTVCTTTEDITIPAYGNDPDDHKHPELGINGNSTLKTVAAVAPTCTAGGHKEYKECTRCSYSQYVLDHDAYYLAALGHEDQNADGKCDACKTTIEENAASKNCGCICHKDSGFMKFIYKILKFFWKLFGMNKNCACGVAHY